MFPAHRAAALATLLALAAPPVHAASLSPCTMAIAKATERYAKTKHRILATCENRRASGSLPPSTNCRPDAGPVTHAPTAALLQQAGGKAYLLITSKCTGALPPIGGPCNSAATAADLAYCITAPVQEPDVDNRTVDTVIDAVYGASAPLASNGLLKCQSAIAQRGAKYLLARMQATRQCHERRAAGAVSACPDSKAADAYEKARAQFEDSIRHRCTDDELKPTATPRLDFGGACQVYIYSSFVRGPGNSNSLSPVDQAIGCFAAEYATVADRTTDIGLPGAETSAFADGVAAGDATDTTAIFWTRLPNASLPATLEISTDKTFGTGVQTISVSSTPVDDGTVKADVGSLLPFTEYFYRFKQGTNTSAVGRVKTTPTPADASTTVKIGWSGDTNAYYRPYNSLDPVRLQNPDSWFYIGDTIYGDDPLADGVVSSVFADYAGKYRLNRTDQSLRNLMEATGTYAQWDDHEVRNDFAGAVPAFAAKMAEGNRAFRKFMPLREDPIDPMQLYRSVRMGAGAEFFLIDDRQYRSAKYTCCSAPDQASSGFVLTDDDTTCPGGSAEEQLLPEAACLTAMADPSRTILGAAQKAWLENGLLNSTAQFKFIMNGPPVTQLGFIPYDRWEAWSAERTEILDFIVNNNIKNVIWLSTDFHTIIFSPVRIDATHNIPELVSGSIGENTLLRELPPSVVGLLPFLPGFVPQVTEYELDRYNAVLLTLNPTAKTAKFDFADRTGQVIHTITYTAVP